MQPTPLTGKNRTALLAAVYLAVCVAAWPVMACDTDAECAPGGTCIKREKRARGVCYGRTDASSAPATGALGSLPRPLEGLRRERALEIFGEPEQNIKEQLPGKAIGGVCMVNQDCPSGSECVVAGFEGRCVTF